ncbi:MAG: G1 family glutamic endopeptidase [Candidatus Saccharibacteria bacterium]
MKMLQKSLAKKYILITLFLSLASVLIIIIIWYFGLTAWRQQNDDSRRVAAQVQTPPPVNSVTTTRDSANIWAGYVATGQTFTSVEGKVKVPKISCTSDQDAFGAWVGFDGYGGGSTVEQAGISVTCDNTTAFNQAQPIDGASYYAWGMMFGAGSSDFFDITVRPDDVIYYKVSFENDTFAMEVDNLTLNQSAKKAYSCELNQVNLADNGGKPCPRYMAEWIVERPGNSSLASFDGATLYDNKATAADGRTQYANSFDTVQLDMVQAGTLLAETGKLQPRGSFTVLRRGHGVIGD